MTWVAYLIFPKTSNFVCSSRVFVVQSCCVFLFFQCMNSCGCLHPYLCHKKNRSHEKPRFLTFLVWNCNLLESAGIYNPWVKIEFKVPELAHDMVEYLRLTSFFMTCSTVWVRVRNHRFLPYSLSPRTPRNYSTWICTKMLQVGEGTMKWPEKKQEKDLQFPPKKCYCNCFHFSPASCEPPAVRPPLKSSLAQEITLQKNGKKASLVADYSDLFYSKKNVDLCVFLCFRRYSIWNTSSENTQNKEHGLNV